MGILQAVPDLGLDLMTLPVSFDGRRPPVRRRAPTLGEHTKEIVAPPFSTGS
jgi:crotonobetainyl-CoA:carnitine CoA-transferase CaiB-like acyl-CoA transferase